MEKLIITALILILFFMLTVLVTQMLKTIFFIDIDESFLEKIENLAIGLGVISTFGALGYVLCNIY